MPVRVSQLASLPLGLVIPQRVSITEKEILTPHCSYIEFEPFL